MKHKTVKESEDEIEITMTPPPITIDESNEEAIRNFIRNLQGGVSSYIPKEYLKNPLSFQKNDSKSLKSEIWNYFKFIYLDQEKVPKVVVRMNIIYLFL